MDVTAIRQAIVKLRDNPELRRRMSVAARQKATTLDINIRATNIVRFMEQMIARQINMKRDHQI